MYSWDEIKRDNGGNIILLYRHQRMFDEGLITPDSKCLDVGGWGVLASKIVDMGASCTILDLIDSPDQYFPERVKKMKHIKADISQSSFTSADSYDVVTCFETLEHIGDQETAVKNIISVLRPGGVFVGTVPIPGFCHFIGEPGIKFISEEGIAALASSSGVVLEKCEPTGSVSLEEEPSSVYFVMRKE